VLISQRGRGEDLTIRLTKHPSEVTAARVVQPHPLYKRLGREITQRRKALRITQQSLADAIGISRAAVANIERGEQRVFFDQIVAIASYLGANSVDELLNTSFGTPSVARAGVSLSGANLNRSERAEVRRILEELGSV